MGKVTGFLEYARETPQRRPAGERVRDFFGVSLPFADEKLQIQGARCMDCGVPFCNWGCPVNNFIPDWNDMVFRGRWREAIRALHATNNFPEFTGRLCPAPCETSCVLGINQEPVTIKSIENAVVERAFNEGWIQPEPPEFRTGKRVAVVGSGPAGLAAAQQLNRAGHKVVVFEKEDRIGGLLRYGIPDFKLEKDVLDRRIDQLQKEGIEFQTGAHVGADPPVAGLRRKFDAMLLTCGAEQARDLNVPGRELKGIHYAMDFLIQQNRRCAGERVDSKEEILATGKRVAIIGGGDTGADCLGTSHRQRALSVHQLEILPEPPPERAPETPWPLWPLQLRTESSHEEGGIREWGVSTFRFAGDEQGNVTRLDAQRVGPPPDFAPIPNTGFSLEVDLVILAMGFTGAQPGGLLEQLGVYMDDRGRVAADDNFMTPVPGIFTAGDMHRGQSLIVWAIAEGRQAAAAINRYLSQQARAASGR
jgi:glutamate synthase (NADPH/NADH) small chain